MVAVRISCDFVPVIAFIFYTPISRLGDFFTFRHFSQLSAHIIMNFNVYFDNN